MSNNFEDIIVGRNENNTINSNEYSVIPGKWKENFSETEKRTIEEIMGPTLVKIGY